ncbi:MAG: hypothetical protein ACYCW6_19470 [Candidatus Xenobia bacterium]
MVTSHIRPRVTPPAPAPPAKADNSYEEHYRNLLNVGGHLVGSDGPSSVAMVANTVPLPPALNGVVGVANILNTYTSFAATAGDLRLLKDTRANPNRQPGDVRAEVAHLVVSDVLPTASGMLPMFTSVAPLAHPVTYGLFLVPQLAGMVGDWKKMRYDQKRHGQQSALPDAHEPRRLVLDNVEKSAEKLSQLGGAIAVQSMLFGGIPMIAAQPLMALGGTFAIVGAQNQVSKSKELQKVLEEAKAHSVESVPFPVFKLGHKQPEMVDTPIDQAVAAARRQKRWGYVQGASGVAMVLAGATGIAAFAAASLGMSLITLGAGGAIVAYKHRQAIVHGVKHAVTGVKQTEQAVKSKLHRTR